MGERKFNMKYFNELDDKMFLQESDAITFFNDVCNTDIWQHCRTNELTVVPIDNAPILLTQLRNDANITKEVSDDSVRECMESVNLCLRVPFEYGYKVYPLGETSLSTLIQRAGYQQAPVLLSTTPKKQMDAMAPCDKTAVLNYGLQMYNNKSLVLIRDEKVRAVLSGDDSDYQILPMNELGAILKTYLLATFADVQFDTAFASHSYMSISYTFGIEGILSQEASIMLARAGISADDMKGGITLVSSDVGLSGATLYSNIHGNGKTIMFGFPLSLVHKGNSCLNNYEKNVDKIFSMFKDSSECLEAMNMRKVSHPRGCLLRAAKQSGLPKKLSYETAESIEALYGANCYQSDIFFALYDILENHAATNKLSPMRMIQLSEGISRVAFGNFAEYDIPYEWE